MPKRAPKQLGTVRILLGRKSETKPITTAIFSVRRVRGSDLWSFDVETMESDGSLTVDWADHSLSNQDLVGTTILIPFGYDSKTQRHIASVYYSEHFELDANRIKIVAREGMKYHVRWTAECPELARYEGVNRCKVVVDGLFRFKGIEDVPDRPVRLLLQDTFDQQRLSQAHSLRLNGYVVESVATFDAVHSALRRVKNPPGLAVCWWPTAKQALALAHKARRAGYGGGLLFVLSKWDEDTIAKLAAAGAQYILPEEPDGGVDSARVDEAIAQFVV